METTSLSIESRNISGVSDENAPSVGCPMLSPSKRSQSARKSLGALDGSDLNQISEKQSVSSPSKVVVSMGTDKASAQTSKTPRSIKKMLSTPVKAIRNLLPSVPQGWYGSESTSADAGNTSEADNMNSPSASLVSVSERIAALKKKEEEKKEKLAEKDTEKEKEAVSTKRASSRSSSRRVSIGLSMKSLYDEETHMPKYSQAELDAAVKKAIQKMSVDASGDLKDKVAALEADKAKLGDELQMAKAEAMSAASSQATAAKELLEARASLNAIGEDAGLQKVQSKALTHRLQSLEKDFAELQTKHDEAQKAVTVAVEAAVQEATVAHTAALAEEKARCEATLKASAEESERQADGLRQALEGVKRDAESLRAKHTSQVAAAVKEAKARVYEKAKQQFEAGNKEFKTVRQQLKDACAEKDAQKVEHQKLVDQMNTTQEEKDILVVKLASVEGHLHMLLEALGIKEVADLAAAVTVASAQHAHNTSALQTAQLEVEQLRLRTPDLEARCAAAETSVTSLEAKVALNQETLRATEALLEESKKEASAAQRESEAQMTAVAKLTTANANLEQSVEAKEKEVRDLTTRCANLRKMNEEVLTMLESAQMQK